MLSQRYVFDDKNNNNNNNNNKKKKKKKKKKKININNNNKKKKKKNYEITPSDVIEYHLSTLVEYGSLDKMISILLLCP